MQPYCAESAVKPQSVNLLNPTLNSGRQKPLCLYPRWLPGVLKLVSVILCQYSMTHSSGVASSVQDTVIDATVTL